VPYKNSQYAMAKIRWGWVVGGKSKDPIEGDAKMEEKASAVYVIKKFFK
jgi:hypothetical protein